MKTRKTMMEILMAYHKKHGGYSVTVILSELLWNKSYVTMAVETSDGTECGRVRVPRTMHTYRLKSARGRYSIRRLAENGAWIMRHCDSYRVRYLADDGVWRIRNCDTYQIPRVVYNPLHVYAYLHNIGWEVSII